MMAADAIRCRRVKSQVDIPLDGLVSWYTMDSVSGTTLLDETGNHDGRMTNVTQVDGPIGKALLLNGGYVNLQYTFDFIHQTCVFSYNTFVSADHYDDGNIYCISGSSVNLNQPGFFLAYEDRDAANANKAIRFDIFNGNTNNQTLSLNIDNAQPTSGMHLISVDGDGDTVSIYVDNILKGSAQVGIKSADIGFDVYLGASYEHYSHSVFGRFFGLIDDTLIYDRPLSQSERGQILSLMV